MDPPASVAAVGTAMARVVAKLGSWISGTVGLTVTRSLSEGGLVMEVTLVVVSSPSLASSLHFRPVVSDLQLVQGR